eukprot:TRINITY_DN6822_c0_g1_i1.p1 TRINITY_DN6822_c0_g1~~TRINITY_DN6822_c0_g1_i1.p1  ORF type:complete len:188 (+),score=32.87 TRINITY_DN6822_c0_g1_i1:169-732(+)
MRGAINSDWHFCTVFPKLINEFTTKLSKFATRIVQEAIDREANDNWPGDAKSSNRVKTLFSDIAKNLEGTIQKYENEKCGAESAFEEHQTAVLEIKSLESKRRRIHDLNVAKRELSKSCAERLQRVKRFINAMKKYQVSLQNSNSFEHYTTQSDDELKEIDMRLQGRLEEEKVQNGRSSETAKAHRG